MKIINVFDGVISHILIRQRNILRESKKTDKQYVDELDYPRIKFPVSLKQYNRIEKQKNINVNVFDYEAKQPFQSIYQKNNLKMR